MKRKDRIEWLRTLKQIKEDLSEEMKNIQIKISENERGCHHLSVEQKAIDMAPYYGYRFRCLFCNKDLGSKTVISIDAKNYLSDQYNDFIPQQADEKFDCIQTMAMELLEQNPDIKDEELVKKLNCLMSTNKQKKLK